MMRKFKTLLIILGVSVVAVSSCNLTINEIGLKLLSRIKKIKGNTVSLSEIGRAEMPTMQHNDWTQLLQQHVNEEGQVNYRGFMEDSIALTEYLGELSTHVPGENWTEAEALAYWINAYNAFTVKLIVDHYPLESIKDIADGLPMINSPWDIKFFKIGETDFDLNTIEHDVLRKRFDEPRIHFAINCASFSCPKLLNEAYTAERLEQQLEEQTKVFINDPNKNIITDKETQLSKIFNWYQNDFTKAISLDDYLEQYHPNFRAENKIEYVEYNWALNE